MTLSTISMTDKKRYKMAKVRTARMPINWNHRDEWISMFELLAHVMVRLQLMPLFVKDLI